MDKTTGAADQAQGRGMRRKAISRGQEAGSSPIPQDNGAGDGGKSAYEQIYAPSLLGGAGGDMLGMPTSGEDGDVIGKSDSGKDGKALCLTQKSIRNTSNSIVRRSRTAKCLRSLWM